jgi:hypothetical protein
VSHLGAPPLIFIGVSKGALSRQMRGTHAEPHLGGAEEPPCGRGKSVATILVGPNHEGRLNQIGHQSTSASCGRLIGGPYGP